MEPKEPLDLPLLSIKISPSDPRSEVSLCSLMLVCVCDTGGPASGDIVHSGGICPATRGGRPPQGERETKPPDCLRHRLC